MNLRNTPPSMHVEEQVWYVHSLFDWGYDIAPLYPQAPDHSTFILLICTLLIMYLCAYRYSRTLTRC